MMLGESSEGQTSLTPLSLFLPARGMYSPRHVFKWQALSPLRRSPKHHLNVGRCPSQQGHPMNAGSPLNLCDPTTFSAGGWQKKRHHNLRSETHTENLFDMPWETKKRTDCCNLCVVVVLRFPLRLSRRTAVFVAMAGVNPCQLNNCDELENECPEKRSRVRHEWTDTGHWLLCCSLPSKLIVACGHSSALSRQCSFRTSLRAHLSCDVGQVSLARPDSVGSRRARAELRV